jgi:hypothetical protein
VGVGDPIRIEKHLEKLPSAPASQAQAEPRGAVAMRPSAYFREPVSLSEDSLWQTEDASLRRDRDAAHKTRQEWRRAYADGLGGL